MIPNFPRSENTQIENTQMCISANLVRRGIQFRNEAAVVYGNGRRIFLVPRQNENAYAACFRRYDAIFVADRTTCR